LKFEKKLSHGFVALVPNQYTNDGIDIIFTPVIVVQTLETNGIVPD
jgi:hypothetical protein